MKPQVTFLKKPVAVVVVIGLLIFAVELLIMVGVSISSSNPFSDFWGIADPVLLVSILSPVLYVLVFRPMRDQHAHLEQIISQRTEALALANQDALAHEALLEQILETTSTGIFLADEQGRIKQSNQAMATLFRTTMESMRGREYVSLVHPDDLERSKLNIQRRSVGKGEFVDVDRRYIRSDQTPFWGYLSGRSFLQQGQTDRTFVFTITDVTQRKQTEEANRIAATAFESQQGMTITNAQGTILQVNKAFTSITGYSAEDVIGKNPRVLQSGRQDEVFYKTMWECIHRTGSWQGEVWNRRKNGEIYPEWLNVSAVKDDAGVTTHYVGAFNDIGEHKAAAQRIENLAFYDPLTNLPNRALMQDRLKHALASSARRRRDGALLLIDLDNFKTINDSLGHAQGDLLIQQVAKRLRACLRESDTLARVGGDEFVALLEDPCQDGQSVTNQAHAMGDKILVVLRDPYVLNGTTHHSSASIGITLFDGAKQDDVEEPLKQAELAMYQAKTVGRNTLRFFDPQMQASVSARVSLESRMREALAKNQFLLHYQPQVDALGQVTGAEALVRWLDPKRGMVSPGEFIPIAEVTGLILLLGQWVLESACSELARWARDPKMAHMTVAVNVSARQFQESDFVQSVLDALRRNGAKADRLKLELTESMLADNINGVIEKMSILKRSGVSFSLDDFGTGYSSLAYLKRLPLDQLKIDQGFVRDILVDSNDAAIAKTVIALADSMGLAVIAEGVETQEQREFLAGLGCPAYQGYLFSRPLPLDEFEAFAKNRSVRLTL
ncbi:EAL domain-containing protein [Rhodoferax sp.]|uniref:EAL domain-containing protein n=1 Tax=Rhodoferax sp. TaxID=50421 RepID=UPI002629C047|nr:EAL domain-containing protein [Rhodoferax sp.]MDD2809372.1 EAL domain-containing protein [Rhodoferax sp.]